MGPGGSSASGGGAAGGPSAAPHGASQSQTNLIPPPNISLPKGGGAIRGMGEKFAANPVTGSGSMSVPIATSPGRSGFGPQLSLSYDSGAGNGPFGFGWSLALPAITRKTDKGLPRYRDWSNDPQEADVFVLSGSEDLVPVLRQGAAGLEIHDDLIDGYRVRRYRPRIEGLFARIERWQWIPSAADPRPEALQRADLQRELGPDLTVQRGDLHRPSLTLQSLRIPSQPARLAWLAHTLPGLEGSGIVYALTTRDAVLVAEWLQTCGIDVRAYTGTMENGDRETLEEALIANQCKALVATTALGMGYDKPDLGFVIHYQVPGSVVAYYQQVGRAGRALPSAYGVLLSGEEELAINNWFILSAFPTRSQVESLLEALEQGPEEGCTEAELLAQLNLPKGRLQQALKILSLETPAPIGKQGSRWQRLPASLQPEFWQRVERLTQQRQTEAQQMQAYVDLSFGEHMTFLIEALDGDPSAVGPPTLPPLPAEVPEDLTREAASFLRHLRINIQPRKQWPAGGLPSYSLRGRIPPNRQAEPGKALSFWSDAGWAELVKRGKYTTGRFDEALVEGCIRLIQQWRPAPSPEWVTCIPSRRHPELVPAFTERLAASLGLPFVPALEKVLDTAEQKAMANSSQQARNLDGSLVVRDPIPTGPCLLIDDMVDSRWTFTVAAWLLREHGCGPVFPLALAQTGQSD